MSKGLIAAACLLFSTPVFAGDVADASYTPAQDIYGFGLGAYEPLAQTFTVENTGMLDRIEVAVERVSGFNAPVSGSVTLSIAKLDGGMPSLSTSDVLTSATRSYDTFPQEGVSGYILQDFNISPVSVTAGEKLAIVLTAADTYGYFGWNGDLGNCCGPDGTYSGGQGYYASPTSFNGSTPVFTSWSPIFGGTADFNFKTFVTPGIVAAVPEPATWAMMIGGIGLTGGALRRRTRTTIAFA